MGIYKRNDDVIYFFLILMQYNVVMELGVSVTELGVSATELGVSATELGVSNKVIA